MKTFFTFSFGCRVNEAEKEEIDRQMINSGFQFDSKSPDIFIINTCSVTQKAEREARQLVYQTRKKLPKTKIVITGCSTTYWLKNNLYKNLPVDMMIDNVNKEFLVEIIKKRLINTKLSKINNNKYKSKNTTPTSKFLSSKRVVIKIQDGCQRYCSFCIVPYLRGMPKSEKIKNLELEIKNLTPPPSEIILTAINTQAFGYDTKESFIDLLKTIIDNTNIPRISLGSIHPWSLTNEFFDFYQKYLPKKRLVDFFHIPIQSGSNKILNLMKRGYTKEELLEKLSLIKKINPLAFIGTDIIVGFLEEDDDDFQDTYEFLEKAPIDRFHIFRFSIRKKTQADYLRKKLKEPSASEKEKRAKALIQLGLKKYNQFLKINLGRITTGLLLDKISHQFQEALLDNQLPILIPRTTSEVVPPGSIKNIKIIEFKNGRLFGKII